MRCLDIGGTTKKVLTLKKRRVPCNRTPLGWISININKDYKPTIIADATFLPFKDCSFNFVRLWCFPAGAFSGRLLLEIERILIPTGIIMGITGKDIKDEKWFECALHDMFDNVSFSKSAGTFMGTKEV